MRKLIICTLLLTGGCAGRGFASRGDSTAEPDSSASKSMPGESLEEVRPKLKTNLDPDRAPDPTNYD